MVAILGALGACAHDQPASSAVASAPAAPPGKYALQLKLTAGDVRRYAVEVNLRVKASANDVPVMDAPAKMTYLDVLQIGSASGDGATEIKERFENFQVSGEGQMGEMMKQMMGPMGKIVVTTSVKPDGTVVSTKTDGAEGEMMRDMARRMGRAKFNNLPKTPVGPGDTWTTEDKEAITVGMGRPAKLLSKSKHTFVRVEPCGSKQCAVVETDVELSIGEGGEDVSGAGKGHSSVDVALDDAQPIKSAGQQELKMQGSQGGQPFEAVQTVSFSAQLQ